MAEAQVILAAVAGAHGVGGEVRLKLFSDDIESVKRHARVQVGDRELDLVSVRPGGGGAIARFAGIADRNAAEALRGQLLSVPRSALPPLAPGEYYHADLIGLPCDDRERRPIGKVAGVENFGAGDLLDVEQVNGRRALIPFRPGIADLEDGRIVVDPAFLA